MNAVTSTGIYVPVDVTAFTNQRSQQNLHGH